MPPYASLTVDSLFSGWTKPAKYLQDNIYVAAASKATLLGPLAYALNKNQHRVFAFGPVTVVLWHDAALVGQVSTVYQVDFTHTNPGFVPVPTKPIADDASVLLLAKLAKVDPAFFDHLASLPSCTSGGKTLPSKLAAMCNLSTRHVNGILAAEEARVSGGTSADMEIATEKVLILLIGHCLRTYC